MIRVTKATGHDILEFSKNIRAMDKEEVEKATGHAVALSLLQLFDEPWVQAIRSQDGTLLGLGGVVPEPMKDGKGVRGWMLLTKAVETHKIEFLRWSKSYVRGVLNQHKYIYNDVYKYNDLHVDYLQWLGAKFVPHPYRDDFYSFVIERS